jgi:hypothetical protein
MREREGWHHRERRCSSARERVEGESRGEGGRGREGRESEGLREVRRVGFEGGALREGELREWGANPKFPIYISPIEWVVLGFGWARFTKAVTDRMSASVNEAVTLG